MKESAEYKAIKRALYHFELQRIESTIGLGIPDVYFSHNEGTKGWMELKQFRLKKKPITPIVIPFEAGQYGWARRYLRRGTLVILVCWTGQGLFCFTGDNIKQEYSGLADFYNSVAFHSTKIDEEFRKWLISLH